MLILLVTLALAAGLSAQTVNVTSDAVRTVARLELERYKAHIKGLTQFGDRMQGTQRNRDAIDWLEKQLRSFGYSNVERHRFMSGSGTYALERAPLQGTAAEPKWLGVIQHDMMMFDHGMPPGPKQSPNADINIEYQENSRMAGESAKLAAALQAGNRAHAHDYPATIGTNMAGTDSI